MGSADVVPGVSGGTIAFITGIYEELLQSISSINLSVLKTLRKEGVKAAWNQINGNFLAVLLLGIATSFLTLAKVVTFLLEHYPIHIWSFFFGLVLASVWLVGKTIEKWDATAIISLIIGTGIAYYITILPPFADSQNLLYIFICGAIAICAMILPGISGSFILVLLGAYTTVLGSISKILSALKDGDWGLFFEKGLIVGVFLIGCLTGLLSFSRLLNFLFKKAKNIVLAVLTGFLIGSLNKIWPWKQTTAWFTKHEGEPNMELIPLIQENVSPGQFETLAENGPHTEAYLFPAIGLFLVGIALLVVLERFSPKTDA